MVVFYVRYRLHVVKSGFEPEKTHCSGVRTP